jgi:iron(III) transport system permease protein
VEPAASVRMMADAMANRTAIVGSRRRGDRARRALRRLGGGSSTGLLAISAVAVTIVVLPVLVSLMQALQGGPGAALDSIKATSATRLLLHTGLVTAVAVPASGVLGVFTAWFVERTRLPWRGLWTLLVVAPLTMPLFVTSYAWSALSPSLNGYLGAAGIISFSYYPIVFLLVAAALRNMDPALEETARSLGLSARQAFFRVVMPQLRPALLGGLLLVLLDTLVEFDAFVALKYQTFSVNVYAQYQLSFSASGAAALSLLSIVLCVFILFGESRLRGNASYARVSHGARRAIVRQPLGRAVPVVLGAFVLIAAVGVGIPFGELIHWFTQGSGAAATASVHRLGSATVTSVALGVASGVVAVALALPVAMLAVRHKGPLVTMLERGTYLSFALPDLVAAIALAYAASHYVHFLYGNFALLTLADAMLFVPFAVVALRTTLGQIEPALEDSARALGAGPARALWRVTLPLARPGLAAAGVLVFAFALGDLSTAQVLLPPNAYTLGTEFQANSSTVAFAAAAPFGAMLVGLSLAATYVLMNRFGRVRVRGAVRR